jgi:hypothetical protein
MDSPGIVLICLPAVWIGSRIKERLFLAVNRIAYPITLIDEIIPVHGKKLKKVRVDAARFHFLFASPGHRCDIGVGVPAVGA